MATPMDGRPRLRRSAAASALALALAATALAAAPASAAPLSLRVVNERGTQQASLVSVTSPACGGSCGTAATDGHGRLTLDVDPGDRLAVTRGSLAPEGAGVGVTVANPVPATPLTVTLPALPGTVTPGIDAYEAWIFNHVNAARAALGRAPFALSSTLSRAADAYAHYLASTDQFSHTALSTPGVRAVDQGWPVPGGNAVGETLALAPSKELAFAGWQQSTPHWTLLMAGGLDSAGVAEAGGRWIMMPAACGSDARERCGLGADPAVVPPGSADRGGGPQPIGPHQPGAAPRKPRLRVALRRHGRKLIVRIRVVRGEGRLHVAVRRGHHEARLRHGRAGDVHRFAARLRRGGTWTVAIRFEGAAGWSDAQPRPRSVHVRKRR